MIIASAISKSAMTPSFIGLMASIFPGVLPSIDFASLPTAKTDLLFLLSVAIATTDGSFNIIPFPFTYTSVLAVPRSKPISSLKNELKDFKSFVYSINNFDYNNDYHTKKVFESEKNLSGDFKSITLPSEDFESIFSLDVETRLSQYEEAPHLVSCTEKTLKSFLFKRPTINVMQKEAYEYFESFGFIFPNYFGLNHKTEQIQICKKICELSLEDCKSMALEYSYAYETNYKKVMDFLKHHKIKLDNIFYELYHK